LSAQAYQIVDISEPAAPPFSPYATGTADMDPLEAIALVFGFYATALLCYAFVLGSWNPVSYTLLVLLEANMNMMGRCSLIYISDPKLTCIFLFCTRKLSLKTS